VTTQDRVNGATLSPDGRWVAYYTEDVDGPQAYVMTFPTGQRIRLSTTSGYWPQRSQDGRHIIYVTEEWHFMEVPVKVTNGTIRPGKSAELFVQRQDTPGYESFCIRPGQGAIPAPGERAADIPVSSADSGAQLDGGSGQALGSAFRPTSSAPASSSG
jgi:hypothetical protein